MTYLSQEVCHMKNKWLSPKSDIVFKLIFGDQRNTDILAAFLQAVLKLPESEYDYLSIVDPHLKRDFYNDKLGILDVKVHTKTGKMIDVEVQVSDIPQMRERILFYTAKMITEQINKGEDYSVIKNVVSIVITDYRLIPENQQYHNRYCLYDPNTSSLFTDILEVNTLELPKLPGEDDHTALWDWMLFFKSEREEDFSMLAEKKPQLKKAVGVLMELSQDERTRLLCEEREKARRDEAARMRGAKQEAMREVARNALKMNMSLKNIAELTGLPLAEIEALSREC